MLGEIYNFMLKKLAIAIGVISCFSLSSAAYGNPQNSRYEKNLEIDRQVIESSPVLRRWLENPPDLLTDIHNEPSFNSKLRIGVTSRNNSLGIEAGVEDLFVKVSPLTVSSNYRHEFSGRESEFQSPSPEQHVSLLAGFFRRHH